MAKTTLTGEKVKEYLLKFPDTPTLTLAKLIYKENNTLFNSIEATRTVIRHYRGAAGEENLNGLIDRRFIREISPDNYNPFKLPESDETEFLPFEIPEIYKRMLIIGDVHLPYHSISSLTAMFKFLENKNIDSVLLNGDIIDFHQLSQFVKDPTRRHFDSELDIARQFLIRLKEILGVKIFYKQGNHEERLENYLKVKAPELFGISEFKLYNLLNLESLDITFIKDKRTIKFDKLNILHGHELKGSIIPPVNAARGVFLKTKVPTLVHHFHTKTGHGENSLNEKYLECWSIGCMCELHPEWMPNNRWINGFAIVDRLEVGFSVSSYKILNGIVFK